MPQIDPVWLSDAGIVTVAEPLAAPEFQLAPMRGKPVGILALVLAGFFAGVPPPMVAALGAAVLLITRTTEPKKVYAEIDWGLLVFFIGLFIIVAGAQRASLTATLLERIASWDLHRIPIFVVVTVMLSNVVSNVPAVMLLPTVVPTFPDPHASWLTLAMSSTLAGNLTITGDRQHHRRRAGSSRRCVYRIWRVPANQRASHPGHPWLRNNVAVAHGVIAAPASRRVMLPTAIFRHAGRDCRHP
jgi:hypothetical protein